MMALQIGWSASTADTVIAQKDAIMTQWKSGTSSLMKKRFSASRFPVLEYY